MSVVIVGQNIVATIPWLWLVGGLVLLIVLKAVVFKR